MSQELGREQKTRQKQLLVFWSQINSRRARLIKMTEIIITDVVAIPPGVPENLIA